MASECRSLAQVAGRGIDSDPAEHTGKRAPAGIVRVKRVLPPWRSPG